MTVQEAQAWLGARMVSGSRGPGVLDTILEAWSEGTPEQPITMAETLAFVTERFPQKDTEKGRSGLVSSISQAKFDLKMKRGIVVEGTMKLGFYVKEQLVKS